MVSLRVRKASTLACSRWLARVSFSSSPCSWACWVCRSVSCCCRPDRRVSASRARSSRPTSSAFCACCGQLVGLGVQLVGLQLDPLPAGGDVGDAPPDLLQQLQLPLVGVVEGLARILDLVQGLVGLGPEDQRDPLKDAGHVPQLVLPSHRVAAGGRSQAPPYRCRRNRHTTAHRVVSTSRVTPERIQGPAHPWPPVRDEEPRGTLPPEQPRPLRRSRSPRPPAPTGPAARRTAHADPQGGRGRAAAAGEAAAHARRRPGGLAAGRTGPSGCGRMSAREAHAGEGADARLRRRPAQLG